MDSTKREQSSRHESPKAAKQPINAQYYMICDGEKYYFAEGAIPGLICYKKDVGNGRFCVTGFKECFEHPNGITYKWSKLLGKFVAQDGSKQMLTLEEKRALSAI